jgi:hypothetical protein
VSELSLTLREIESEIDSQIDYMIGCVNDSMGTIDPTADLDRLENIREYLQGLFKFKQQQIKKETK